MTRVLDAKTSIKSMRDAGYKNEAYAIAELMDNSIQASADLVELITFSKANDSGRKNIDSIAIFDNGKGMPPGLLQRSLSFGQGDNQHDSDGMGKFGFGLPSASISQCKHVDVWSWTNPDEIYKTHIDVDDMLDGNGEDVPAPTRDTLPDNIKKAIGDVLPDSGTVVLWSKIDRATWKTAAAISKHVEHEIGRMYRYYINRDENPVTIRFKSYEQEGSVYVLKGEPKVYRASDPLGLMRNTSAPELPGDFVNESCFEVVKDVREIQVRDENGEEHMVVLRWSIVKQSVVDAVLEQERSNGSNKTAGDTELGRYLKKNQGISVVRAGRELVLRKEILSKDEKWRWVGMEVSFPPALDSVFGVLNNKQDAVNFNILSKSDDADNEGFDNPLEYEKSLDVNDPIVGLYKVSQVIVDFKKEAKSALDIIKVQLPNRDDTPPNPDDPVSMPTGPSHLGDLDPEPLPDHDVLVASLVGQGIPKSVALVVARKVEKEKVRYLVQESELSTDAFFDVTHAQGITLILINKNHIFYENILANCDESQKRLIELAIGSFGYMEHSSRDNKLQKAQYQRTRNNWGVYLEDVLLAVSQGE